MNNKGVIFRDVDKWFGEHKVLDQLSFKLGEGEKVVICGPSGSGKSTMIRCINGLERIQAGYLNVLGHVVSEHEHAYQAIRQEVGMLFQQFNLFPHLTAIENCCLALEKVRHMKPADAIEVATHYLDQVGMLPKKDVYPSSLSGGQQQRVAMARSLCLEPKLILFDEPTSALDPEMVREVLKVMETLAAAGMQMLVVTHELQFARLFADRICFFEAGKIVVDAEPEQFFQPGYHPRLDQFLAQILDHND